MESGNLMNNARQVRGNESDEQEHRLLVGIIDPENNDYKLAVGFNRHRYGPVKSGGKIFMCISLSIILIVMITMMTNNNSTLAQPTLTSPADQAAGNSPWSAYFQPASLSLFSQQSPEAQALPSNSANQFACGQTRAAPDDWSPSLLNKIKSDDCSGEFTLTEEALCQVGAHLEEFARREQIPSTAMTTNNAMITNWLLASYRQQPVTTPTGELKVPDATSERVSRELDRLYETFWSKFKRLIEIIVVERPDKLGPTELAYRCERRYQELRDLKQLAQGSVIYTLVLDTFFTELYIHCFARKLALIKLNNARASSVVRQFVDIYLDLPPRVHLPGDQTKSLRESALDQLQADKGLNFDLRTSLKTHGPLEKAAELVLDSGMGLSIGGAMDTGPLVSRFKQECQQHVFQLDQLWGAFDGVAAYLSSATNGLAGFNAQVKLQAPQLMYGSICAQLAQ